MANKFVNQIVKNSSKSEKEILTEKAADFVEKSIISCSMQIQIKTTSEIPMKELEITKAKNTLAKAEKDLVSAQYSMPSDESFESYVNGINQAKSRIHSAKQSISHLESQLSDLNKDLTSYNDILAILKG